MSAATFNVDQLAVYGASEKALANLRRILPELPITPTTLFGCGDGNGGENDRDVFVHFTGYNDHIYLTVDDTSLHLLRTKTGEEYVYIDDEPFVVPLPAKIADELSKWRQP